jgi:hypothetical protein
MRNLLSVISIAAFSVGMGHFALFTSTVGQQPSKPVQEAVRERIHTEHSKLYKQYAGRGDLRAIAAKTSGDVEVVNGTPQKMFRSNAGPFRLGDFLRELTSKSDAVLIGIVKERASFSTAEGTFVFTDYDLAIEQILKNNSTNLLRPFDKISVTRPGGDVQLDGHKVRALDESLEPLAIGSRYLLFLDYVPSTETYKAFSSQGSFRVDGNRAAKLTKEQLPGDLEGGVDINILASYVRAAAQ